MDKKIITYCLEKRRLSWQKHALSRMFERDIYKEEVRNALMNGEIFEKNEDDRPFPSFLVLSFNEENKPLHVVASLDKQKQWCYIITAYRPDLTHFRNDFKTRKS